MASRGSLLPLPWDPWPSVNGPARLLRKAVNPDVSVKCLHFQMLATVNTTGPKETDGKFRADPWATGSFTARALTGCLPCADRVPTPSALPPTRRGGGAALIVPVSQPRKLRPREGKPPTKATQQGSGGVGAGALALCL